MKNLSEIAINKVVEIISFKHQVVAQKLVTMGVIPGRNIEILRKSPFGGAYYVKVSNLNFAIREAEAKTIIVKD